MATTSRRMFIGRITVPNNSATSLNSLMASSSLHWGLESDLVSPSLDSIIGSECFFTPDSAVWVGSDANVKNATVGSNYQGIAVAAGIKYSLQDFGPGLIDPNQIYLYSVNGTSAELTFHAR